MPKLRVGLFSFTGDEGCMIVILEKISDKFAEWRDKMDIVEWRILKPERELQDMDVAVIEGAIANERELARIKAIREKAKRIVAVGSCAITGAPSNHRNFFDAERLAEIKNILERFGHLDKVHAIGDFVKVDAQVPGCPVDEDKFAQLMESYFKEFGVG
ncbi:MAG: hypothetical protein QXH27_03935 [Candidatus Micrarchaeia archaeon]